IDNRGLRPLKASRRALPRCSAIGPTWTRAIGHLAPPSVEAVLLAEPASEPPQQVGPVGHAVRPPAAYDGARHPHQSCVTARRGAPQARWPLTTSATTSTTSGSARSRAAERRSPAVNDPAATLTSTIGGTAP